MGTLIVSVSLIRICKKKKKKKGKKKSQTTEEVRERLLKIPKYAGSSQDKCTPHVFAMMMSGEALCAIKSHL